jgi:hypothetical protein
LLRRGPSSDDLLVRPRLWRYIRSFNYGLFSPEGGEETRDSLTLLLSKLTELTKLCFFMSVVPPREWRVCGDLFKDCTFRLRTLMCSFPLDDDFARFLETQPLIMNLIWEPSGEPTHDLSANALPNLRCFCTSYLFADEAVNIIAPGRHITHVSGELDVETLSLFGKYSSPIQAVRVGGGDTMDPRELAKLASHFPNLELISTIDYNKLPVRRFLYLSVRPQPLTSQW